MKQPFFSGIPLWLRLRIYFARHRKNVNENLGLIIALLAAAFAGWSGWEARKDALLGLKIAQRSYLDVRGHQVDDSGMEHGGKMPLIRYKHTLAIYGSSPALQVSEKVNCRTGIFGSIKSINGRMMDVTDNDLALFRHSKETAVENVTPLPPDEFLPGSTYTSEYYCESMPAEGGRWPIEGVIAFGEVAYKDIFGETHYKNFCYYDVFFVPTRLTASEPIFELSACPIHNDGN